MFIWMILCGLINKGAFPVQSRALTWKPTRVQLHFQFFREMTGPMLRVRWQVNFQILKECSTHRKPRRDHCRRAVTMTPQAVDAKNRLNDFFWLLVRRAQRQLFIQRRRGRREAPQRCAVLHCCLSGLVCERKQLCTVVMHCTLRDDSVTQRSSLLLWSTWLCWRAKNKKRYYSVIRICSGGPQ